MSFAEDLLTIVFGGPHLCFQAGDQPFLHWFGEFLLFRDGWELLGNHSTTEKAIGIHGSMLASIL